MDKDTPLYCFLESVFDFHPIKAEDYDLDGFPGLRNGFYQRPNAVVRLCDKLQ